MLRPTRVRSGHPHDSLKEVPVKHRALLVITATAAVTMMVALPPGAAAPRRTARTDRRFQQTLGQFYAQHGYLPLTTVANYYQAQDRAAAKAAALARTRGTQAAPAAPSASLAPVIGTSWQGIADTDVTPPDTNGAIGPNSYLEIVNDKVGIYDRSGGAISTGDLSTLTNDTGNLSDPTELWDPHTQRFYFSLFRWTGTFQNPRIDWGFSKGTNPTDLSSNNWCTFQTNFGWVNGNIPDYPKLGQTKDFLMVGVNFYASQNSQQSEKSQLLWIKKPQGNGQITTCPAAPGSGFFDNLKNADGTQAFTPMPAIQTDPNSTGTV